MKQSTRKLRRYLPYVLIVLFSLALIIPQWAKGRIIMGSDSIFHFNRFYDVAMQLKSGNFSYIISLYGFQQSGRIINALYGPLFAYIQGVLVLLSPSWFGYQLLSRFLLAGLAGIGVYRLLKVVSVSDRLVLPISFIYMTTFSIQYWTYRQGFSSWGAALLPLCLIPAIEFCQTKKIAPIKLALAVSVMLQVHLLSAMFLVLMYLPFYGYGFIRSKQKKTMVQNGLLAVVLTAILTANVWIPLVVLKGQNELLNPFVNLKMGKNGIDGTASYWVYTPMALSLFMVGQLIYMLTKWKHLVSWEKILHITYLGFLFLSTGYFPWQYLVEHSNAIAELIQFPFRFFVPATVLLVVIVAIICQKITRYQSLVATILTIFALLGFWTTQEKTLQTIATAEKNGYVIKPKAYTYPLADYEALVDATHDSDKSSLLTKVVKSTPDYVPIYGDLGDGNNYHRYHNQIIKPNSKFTKRVKNGKLVVEWQAKAGEKVSPTVLVYTGSQVTVNGKVLTHDKLALSEIGRPTITSKEGNNQLILNYPLTPMLTLCLIITAIGWLGLVLVVGHQAITRAHLGVQE